MNDLKQNTTRRPGELGDRETFRRLFRQKIEISIDEANAIVEKHGLGNVHTLQPIYGNIMNANFELTTTQGESFILKIQFRRGGHALEIEHDVAHLLKKETDLPLSEYYVFDGACDVIPYPYLLLKKCPGELGRLFFEDTNQSFRIALAKEFGRILGTIHNQKVPPTHRLPNHDLSQWRTILTDLFEDNIFKREISAFSQSFYPQLTALLDSVTVPKIDDEPVLLWGDAFFYNLLVKQHQEHIQVTAIYDFQSARYGSRQLDFLHIEEGFRNQSERPNARRPEVYRDTSLIDEIYAGYSETGGCIAPLNASHLNLVNAIRKAHQVHYWWDCSGLLHPQTPQMLEDVLAALTRCTPA